MIKVLSYIVLILTLASCSSPKASIENFEGKLVYIVSSELNNPDMSDSINYQIVYAKDSMLRIDNFTPIGKQTYIKHIPKNKAYILMDLGMKKVAIQTIADTLENDNRYLFKKAFGKKKIANRKAKKIHVTDTKFDTTITMNYLEEIPAKYSTAIKGMPGLPVNYSINSSGMWISYQLKTIKEQAIHIDIFGIPSDYEIITLDQFIDLIKD